MATPTAEARIEFRIPRKDKLQIERAAAVQGRTVSDFAKEALVERARIVIDEHEVVRLSNRDRDLFLRMLDADPAPNAALTAAARLHRKRVVR